MKKIILLSMLLCLFTSRVQAQHALTANESLKEVVLVTTEFDSGFILVQDTSVAPTFKKRQPGTAFVLSFVLSGAGQIYNGQNGKAAIMMGTSLVGFALFTSGVTDRPFATRITTTTAGAVGFVLLAGSGVWSMIDAPIVANKLNRENGIAFHLEPAVHYGGAGALVVGPKLRINF